LNHQPEWKEDDKETFILTVTHLTSKYGQ